MADQWHKVALSPNIPASRVSLRVTPLWGILTHLKEKLEHLTEAEKAFAIQSGWMTETHSWNFQRWNSTHQALVVDTGRPPLSMTQAMESLTHMLKTINGDTVTRFAATQDLRQEIRGTVTFQADISFRAPGSDDLYAELVRLHGSALFGGRGIALSEPEPDSADPPSLAPSAVLGSAEAEYMDDGESVHSLADTIMDPGSNSDSDRTSALSSWRRAPIRPLGGHLEYECGGGTTTNLKSTCTGTTNRGTRRHWSTWLFGTACMAAALRRILRRALLMVMELAATLHHGGLVRCGRW